MDLDERTESFEKQFFQAARMLEQAATELHNAGFVIELKPHRNGEGEFVLDAGIRLMWDSVQRVRRVGRYRDLAD